MNILNITNLTNTPYEDIRSKVAGAIEEYEKEENKTLTEEQKQACYDEIDFYIEEFEENGKVADARSFVDNLIVNHDYYSMVKEIAENN
uniref:Uncharacterized protein n=1 Tax=viral metagenome TaxID=1070528 RepID=A0A6M3KAZ5_9ZZZZ